MYMLIHVAHNLFTVLLRKINILRIIRRLVENGA